MRILFRLFAIFCFFSLCLGVADANAAGGNSPSMEKDGTLYIRMGYDEWNENTLSWQKLVLALNDVDTVFARVSTFSMLPNVGAERINVLYNSLRRAIKEMQPVVIYLTSDMEIEKYYEYEAVIPENVTIDGCFHSIEVYNYSFLTPYDFLETPQIPTTYGYVSEGNGVFVGGLAAVNRGTIRRLRVVTPSSSLEVKGSWENCRNISLSVGSIAGINYGTIEECVVDCGYEFDYSMNIKNKKPFEVRYLGTGVIGSNDCSLLSVSMGGIVGRNAGSLRNIDCNTDLCIEPGEGYAKCSQHYIGSAVGYCLEESVLDYVLSTNANSSNYDKTYSLNIIAGLKSGQFLNRCVGVVCVGENGQEMGYPDGALFCSHVKAIEDGYCMSILKYYAETTPDCNAEAYWSFKENTLAGFGLGWKRDWTDHSFSNSVDFSWGVGDESGYCFNMPELTDTYTRNFIVDVMEANALYPSDNWAKDFMSNPIFRILDAENCERETEACLIPTLYSGWTVTNFSGPVHIYTEHPIFGVVEEGAIVRNIDIEINIEGAYLGENTPWLCGPAYSDQIAALGGLANVNRGLIENCHIAGTFETGVQIPFIGVPDILGGCQIGALVGRNEGTIASCVGNSRIYANSGFIYGAFSEHTAVPVDLGGLVGRNMGIVKDCYVHSNSIPEGTDEIYPGIHLSLIEINENTAGGESYNDFLFLSPEEIANRNVGKVIGNNRGGEVSKVYHTTVLKESDYDAVLSTIEFMSVIEAPISQNSVLHEDSYNSSAVQCDGEPWSLYVPEFDRTLNMDSIESIANRQKGYFNTSLSVLNFENPSRWNAAGFINGLSVITDKDLKTVFTLGSWSYVLNNAPELSYVDYPFSIDEDEEGRLNVEIEISDVFDARALSSQIFHTNEVFGSASVSMTDNIFYDVDADLDFLPWDEETTVDGVSRMVSFGSDDAPFTGSFNGNGNIIAGVQGMFEGNTLFKSGKDLDKPVDIRNLTVQGRIYVDIEPYVEIANADECDTIYVPIIVDKLNGTASCVNFDGSVFFDNTLVGERIVVLCLIAEGDGFDRGFMYLFHDEDYNKSMVRIDHNAGVGKGSCVKTATSLVNPNKDLKTNKDRTGSSEAFSIEEFALGVASFWLNCIGVGYEGPYQPLYSVDRITGRPIMADEQNKAIERLVYEVEGLEAGETAEDMIRGGVFYKEEEDVEISFQNRTPLRVLLGDDELVVEDDKVSFKMPKCNENGDVVLSVAYRTTSFNMLTGDFEEPDIAVTAEGVIVINGMGLKASVYTIDGTVAKTAIASSNRHTIRLPKGMYVVSVGSKSVSVLVK